MTRERVREDRRAEGEDGNVTTRAKVVGSLAAIVGVGLSVLAAYTQQFQRQTAIATPVASYPVRIELPWTVRTGSGATLGEPAEPQRSEAKPNVAAIEHDAQPQALAEPAKTTGKPDILPGLIAVKFDLGGAAARASGASGDQIAVSLPVVYNDTSLGAVPIWIDPSGAISVDSRELSRVLSTPNKALAEAIEQSGQGRTSFASLRARGMTVHYDPILNRIVMAKRS